MRQLERTHDSRRVRGEDLHVRNYDADAEHVLWVRLVGETTFEHEYRLAPGACASEPDAVPAGEYDVEVELDGLRRWADRCRIGEGPAEGVVVETGNGTVSITEGLVPVR